MYDVVRHWCGRLNVEWRNVVSDVARHQCGILNLERRDVSLGNSFT
jgi:hypothetical protein